MYVRQNRKNKVKLNMPFDGYCYIKKQSLHIIRKIWFWKKYNKRHHFNKYIDKVRMNNLASSKRRRITTERFEKLEELHGVFPFATLCLWKNVSHSVFNQSVTRKMWRKKIFEKMKVSFTLKSVAKGNTPFICYNSIPFDFCNTMDIHQRWG